MDTLDWFNSVKGKKIRNKNWHKDRYVIPTVYDYNPNGVDGFYGSNRNTEYYIIAESQSAFWELYEEPKKELTVQDLKIGQIVYLEFTPMEIVVLRNDPKFPVGLLESSGNTGYYALSGIQLEPKKLDNLYLAIIQHKKDKTVEFDSRVFDSKEEAEYEWKDNSYWDLLAIRKINLEE